MSRKSVLTGLSIAITCVLAIVAPVLAIEVFNTNQTINTSDAGCMSDALYQAHGFTTDGGGPYRLNSVTLSIGQSGGNAPKAALIVELWSNSGGNPGSPLNTIGTIGAGNTGSLTVSAPGSLIMQNNATYWVVVRANSGAGCPWDGAKPPAGSPSGFSSAGHRLSSNGGGSWNSTDYILQFSVDAVVAPVVAPSNPGNSPTESILLPAFFDGRINNYDAAAPAIVYPYVFNNEVGLVVYDVNGGLLLVVPPALIASAPDNPSTPATIASANGVTLYRIAGDGRGLWQINAPQYNGKTYVLIFPELYSAGGYTSHEF